MDQVKEYLAHLESHGRKQSTIQTYTIYLTRAMEILEEEGMSTDCRKIGVEEIMRLKARLGHLKEGTQLRYLFVLGKMVEFHTGTDPYKGADICWNREEPHRTFISKDEFGILYLNARPQVRLILVFGAFMGLRRAEICGLRDRDLVGSRLTVRGKGHGPDGLVTVMDVPEPVMREIDAFRRYVRASGRPRVDDGLVQGCSQGVWKSITSGTVSWCIRELAEHCDIKATPHSLRRLFATTLYNDAGADLNTLKILMRHSEVETTLRCYVNVDPTRLQNASLKASSVLGAVLGH